MILNNVRLVPELTNGVNVESGAVEIRDGKIIKVENKPLHVSDTSDHVIDCNGKTLLPGLIDLHTHITVLGRVGFD